MSEMLLILLLMNIFGAYKLKEETEGCEITLHRKNDPVVFRQSSVQLLYPSVEDVIQVKVGDVVQFACPGTAVLIDGNTTRKPIIRSTCTERHQFSVKKSEYSWNQISCAHSTVSIARFTNYSCAENAKLVQVGFDLGRYGFFEFMLICFHLKWQTPLYSTYNLTSSIGDNVKANPRPFFHEDKGFYNIGDAKVNKLYNRRAQRRTVNRQLGLPIRSRKYITNLKSFFLSRGHLAAKMDFVYPAQQNATFRYINAAPQWQCFNGVNWNLIEIRTRAYASQHRVDLLVWTGTYGVARLRNPLKRYIPIYLYSNCNVKVIPVPALYWKLIHDPLSKKGIVLIGLNNPYQSNITKSIICTDVSDNTPSWFVNIDRKNITYGYMYACTVPDFRKIVKHAPELEVSDLLI